MFGDPNRAIAPLICLLLRVGTTVNTALSLNVLLCAADPATGRVWRAGTAQAEAGTAHAEQQLLREQQSSSYQQLLSASSLERVPVPAAAQYQQLQAPPAQQAALAQQALAQVRQGQSAKEAHQAYELALSRLSREDYKRATAMQRALAAQQAHTQPSPFGAQARPAFPALGLFCSSLCTLNATAQPRLTPSLRAAHSKSSPWATPGGKGGPDIRGRETTLAFAVAEAGSAVSATGGATDAGAGAGEAAAAGAAGAAGARWGRVRGGLGVYFRKSGESVVFWCQCQHQSSVMDSSSLRHSALNCARAGSVKPQG